MAGLWRRLLRGKARTGGTALMKSEVGTAGQSHRLTSGGKAVMKTRAQSKEDRPHAFSKMEMTLTLEQILRSVDERPTLAAYAQAAREIRSLGEQLQPIRVSLLSTFTIDSLLPYLEVEAARQGFAANTYVGPFNSVRQELLNP